MAQKDWKWYGHPMHFFCAANCQFHLGTLLPNGYLVSTVGDYHPSREQKGEGLGSQREIGMGRTYETMVFSVRGTPRECGCPDVEGWMELDSEGYKDHDAANAGHLEMCQKWARKRMKKETKK